MISKITTCSIVDDEAHLVLVESDVHNGLPDFKIVGAGSVDVRDARDRVRVGLENAGFILPPKRITVSLIPAPLKKSGTIFDVAISVSVLSSFGFIHSENLSEYMILGEVSLDGSLRETSGVLFSICHGLENGIRKFVVPIGNLNECSLLSDLEVFGFKNLYDLAVFFNGDLSEAQSPPKLLPSSLVYPSYSNIQGEKTAKLALVTAISGGHSCGISGGSADLRKRLLEPLTGIYLQSGRDILNKASYRSIECIPDIYDKDIYGVAIRFYKDYRSISEKNRRRLTLGGCINVLEDCDGSRHDGIDFYSLYSCRCQAENPQNCICSPKQLRDRQALLKKIKNEVVDICTIVGDQEDIAEEKLRKYYENAINMQKLRYGKEGFQNADIEDKDVEKYCLLTEDARRFIQETGSLYSIDRYEYYKLLRLSRTIADMEAKDLIIGRHIKAALKLRGLYE